MIECELKQEHFDRANREAEKLGVLRNSIKNGAGNVVGYLGECLVVDKIGGEIVNNNFHYDLIKNGYKIDVKTKFCTSIPQPEYYCSIPAFNIKQECDFYVFVRILENLQKGWILGGIRKEKFFEQATFYKAGELDPSSRNGWKFKADCFNLMIKKLKPLK
jgi:hypothetical protein